MIRRITGIALTALGISGAAVTLFANLFAPLDMADWAWGLVENWQDLTPAFWQLFAAPLRWEVSSSLVAPLNMAALLMLTAVGVRMMTPQHGVELAYPVYQLIGGVFVLSAIAYMTLTSQSQASEQPGLPTEAPLAVFLAGSAASFSSPLIGGGNLIKRLWMIVAALLALAAANEMTKLFVSA